MRLIVSVFLVAIVSASAFRLPAPPPGGLSHDLGKQAKNMLNTVRLIQTQIRNVKLQKAVKTDDMPTDLGKLLQQLEAASDGLLDKMGPILDLTPAQVAQAEADIETLIKDIRAIEHGEVDADGGLEKIVIDIFNILRDFGAPVQPRDVSEVTTPKSALDELLEELEDYMLVFLPLIAPDIGLDIKQVLKIEKYVHSFVIHTEDMEHGTLSLIDGALYLTIDLLNIAEVFGVDVTLPTYETPTSFDEMLETLEVLFDAMFEIVGIQTDVPEDKIKKIQADLDSMVKDLEAIEHGEISILNGIEALLQDIINYFQDFEDEPSPTGDIKA